MFENHRKLIEAVQADSILPELQEAKKKMSLQDWESETDATNDEMDVLFVNMEATIKKLRKLAYVSELGKNSKLTRKFLMSVRSDLQKVLRVMDWLEKHYEKMP